MIHFLTLILLGFLNPRNLCNRENKQSKPTQIRRNFPKKISGSTWKGQGPVLMTTNFNLLNQPNEDNDLLINSLFTDDELKKIQKSSPSIKAFMIEDAQERAFKLIAKSFGEAFAKQSELPVFYTRCFEDNEICIINFLKALFCLKQSLLSEKADKLCQELLIKNKEDLITVFSKEIELHSKNIDPEIFVEELDSVNKHFHWTFIKSKEEIKKVENTHLIQVFVMTNLDQEEDLFELQTKIYPKIKHLTSGSIAEVNATEETLQISEN